VNLTIAIDDVNPLKDWRILGDKTEKYLFDLNKKYGVKYTLFIPTNYHNESKISDNKQWVKELIDTNIFELAGHGHFHQTSDKNKYGEMEFVDMNESECIERIQMMMDEWESVGYKPLGWRNPGWMCQPYCVPHLSKEFEYAALHKEHNRNNVWDLEMLFGADGIHQTDIKLHNGDIAFHSHICGDWNDNVWNEENYQQLDLSLGHLFENYEITPTTLSGIAKI